MAEHEHVDKIVVKGYRGLDGEYPFNLGDLLALGNPESLTVREQHRIRELSGVRGAEIPDAVLSLDAAAVAALVEVVLRRHDKNVKEELLWDARIVAATGEPDLSSMKAAIAFCIAERDADEDEGGDEDNPPVEAPPETS